MVTKVEVISLGDPLEDHEVTWRAQRCGISKKNVRWAFLVPYLNRLAVIERLDRCLGSGNWRNRVEIHGSGVVSTIEILIGAAPDKKPEWIQRSDGAGFTEIEAFKGGISDALKRAAVLWGIGRELGRMKEVSVMGDRITDGYPPDDGGEYVKFQIKPREGAPWPAWCAAPSITGARKILEQKQKSKRRPAAGSGGGSGPGTGWPPENNKIQGDEQAPREEEKPFEDDIPF